MRPRPPARVLGAWIAGIAGATAVLVVVASGSAATDDDPVALGVAELMLAGLFVAFAARVARGRRRARDREWDFAEAGCGPFQRVAGDGSSVVASLA